MRVRDWREVEAIEGDLSQYRVRAVSLLRKYFKMSVELGRLPSLLGREFFRAQVTSYSTHTFEDAVIFVLDMERALESLDAAAREIISRVILQEYSYQEAAALLRVPERSFARRVAGAIDAFSTLLLCRGLMERTHGPLSATEVGRLKRVHDCDKKQPVSVGFLMGLRNPNFCQARKIEKFRLIR